MRVSSTNIEDKPGHKHCWTVLQGMRHPVGI
jgi:hypothetical protein